MHLKHSKFLEVLILAKENSDNDSGGSGGGNDNGNTISKTEFDELKSKLTLIETANSDLSSENLRLTEHNKKVIDEKRQEVEAKRMLDEEKAIKDKDFQAYKDSSDGRFKDLNDKFEASNRAAANEKAKSAALGIASKLSAGVNISLLSTFIEKRLSYNERGIEVLDEAGNLSSLTLADLESEILNDPKYASLLKGKDSSGGGAGGSETGNGATGKTVTRTELAAMTPIQRVEHFKNKGQVIND